MENSPRLFAPFRARALLVMSTLTALSLTPGAQAAAVGPVPALCRYDVRETASPGWWLTPSQGTVHGTGTITCVGVVHGKQLTGGAGRFEWWYSYGSSDVPLGGNTCALAGGSGTWTADLPTVDGSGMTLTGPWRATGNFVGEVHGQLGGLPAQMVYEATIESDHLDENCVTKPASQGRVLGEGTVG